MFGLPMSSSSVKFSLLYVKVQGWGNPGPKKNLHFLHTLLVKVMVDLLFQDSLSVFRFLE